MWREIIMHFLLILYRNFPRSGNVPVYMEPSPIHPDLRRYEHVQTKLFVNSVKFIINWEYGCYVPRIPLYSKQPANWSRAYMGGSPWFGTNLRAYLQSHVGRRTKPKISVKFSCTLRLWYIHSGCPIRFASCIHWRVYWYFSNRLPRCA